MRKQKKILKAFMFLAKQPATTILSVADGKTILNTINSLIENSVTQYDLL